MSDNSEKSLDTATIKEIQRQMSKMLITKKGNIHAANNKKIAEFIKYLRAMGYRYDDTLKALNPLPLEQMYDICRKYLLLKY